ncbi:MAG TPA: hypothetical protein VHZ02_19865 [Acidimicrobiales bacterium]|jgi:hypothetical protein|nr:hypothetical protein [Acidimicrobiales bacterium]
MLTLPQLRSNQSAFTRYVRAADRPVVVAQLAFIPVVLVPLLVDAGPTAARITDACDTAFWLLFLADYVVRLYLVPTPRHYVVTHLPDLALIALWMLPLFTVPRGGVFIRTVVILRIVPLFLSVTQRIVVLVYRRLGRPPLDHAPRESRDRAGGTAGS